MQGARQDSQEAYDGNGQFREWKRSVLSEWIPYRTELLILCLLLLLPFYFKFTHLFLVPLLHYSVILSTVITCSCYVFNGSLTVQVLFPFSQLPASFLEKVDYCLFSPYLNFISFYRIFVTCHNFYSFCRFLRSTVKEIIFIYVDTVKCLNTFSTQGNLEITPKFSHFYQSDLKFSKLLQNAYQLESISLVLRICLVSQGTSRLSRSHTE